MQSILRLKRHFAIGKYSSDLRCLGTVENFTIGPYDPHPEIGVPDENTVKRLTQAIVLRRLRLPIHHVVDTLELSRNFRPERRRVGHGLVSTVKSRCEPYH